MSGDMKTPLRVRLAAGILSGVMLVCVWSYFDVRQRRERLRTETAHVLALAEQNAPEAELRQAAEALSALWERELPLLRRSVSGGILAGLSESAARLPAETADPDAVRAELLAFGAGLSRLR
ncbi:MAG: hypothetical protein IKS42_01480 [Oscillospiraceae bacterium]|nr:hypothetical protein [Oscillospiraceae bacterium]